jgi:hypothetical protein
MLDMQLIDAILKSDIAVQRRYFVTRGGSHLKALWGLRQIAEWAEARREGRPMRLMPEIVRRYGRRDRE